MEWLQVRAGTWRVDAERIGRAAFFGGIAVLVVVSNGSTILRSSLLAKLADISSRLVGRARYRRIFDGPIHFFLKVVAARADALLRESFDEMILPFTLAVLPFYGASWRS